MPSIDNLYISVSASANGAAKALDKLVASLEKIGGLTQNSGLKELTSQLDTATKSAAGLAGELGKIDGVSAKVTTGTNRMTGAFGGLWQMLKKVASVTAAIALFKKGYGLSTDFFETANYFNVVMGEYSEDAYKYAQTVSEALGLNESEWMQNQATFMSLATTFGNTGDAAYLMSKNLTQLVYDLSSLKNVDATTAMQKLRSAFAGEIEPLRDWGVDLSKANLQLIALEHNITKPFDKMTQAEKSQLRYVTIMNQLEYAMGDLTKTLDSPGNQLRLLEMAAQKAARAFGNIFIPILNKVIPVVIAVTNVIRNLFETIAKFFGFEYPEITNWDKYSAGIDGVSDSLADATGNAKKLKKQLAGFDEINNLTTNSGGSGSGASGTFGGLDLPTYESLGKSFLGDALDQKVQNITASLEPLFTVLKKVFDIAKQNLPLIIGLITTIISFKAIYGTVTLINNITSSLKLLWAVLAANPIVAVIAVIAGLIAAFVTAYKTNEDFRNKVQNTWNSIKTYFQKVVADIKDGILGKFIEFLKNPAIFNSIKNIAKGTWETVKEFSAQTWTTFKALGETILGVFKGVIKFLTGVFKGDWKQALNGLVDVFSSIWEGMKQIFRTPINWIIDGINKFITGINKIQIPDWVPLVGGKGFHLEYIQKLATGGVVNTPTTALIGENGAEAVVPLEHNTQWINKVANEINANQDNSQIVVMLEKVIDAINNKDFDVTIGDSEIYNANKRETNRQNRLLGRAY